MRTMSLVNSARGFLGLTSAPLLPGFTRSERGPGMPVCGTCGALVAYEGQGQHTAWHGDPGPRASTAS